MGEHDLPTMLGYVSHVTKTRDAREPGGGLVYIGHRCDHDDDDDDDTQ